MLEKQMAKQPDLSYSSSRSFIQTLRLSVVQQIIKRRQSMLKIRLLLLIVTSLVVLQTQTGTWADAAMGQVSVVYPVEDTGQLKCYDNNNEISAPASGSAFYGQDAQFTSTQPVYAISADNLTVLDNNTGLTWQRSPNATGAAPASSDKLTWTQAQTQPTSLNAIKYGGFSDWRLPTIKELYSLINFTGTDPSSYTGTDTSVLTPFINTSYFKFAYGSPSSGERIIDAQYASGTTFVVNPDELGTTKLFGVNFADGRIKGYSTNVAGTQKTFFVQCVRGGLTYGKNNFVDNNDGTVTDQATGLMWTKADSGVSMTWQDALSFAQSKNAAGYLGHTGWRLPNAKELQSIVNYSNAPDYNGKPAIDTTYFNATSIVNENGDTDYPYHWTSTTHVGYTSSGTTGDRAVYVAFGRALGWPNNAWVDVHGAGAQRSDPKASPPYSYATVKTVSKNGTTYTGYSFGPQGDALRGLNFVRLVRDSNTTSDTAAASFNAIYNNYASWFGSPSGSIQTGSSWVSYYQLYTNGAYLVAQTDGSISLYYP